MKMENDTQLIELEATKITEVTDKREREIASSHEFGADQKIGSEFLETAGEETLVKGAVEACNVTLYKLVLDDEHGASTAIPNHAFIPSEDERSWRDARTGEGGNVVDLAVKTSGDSRIKSAKKLFEHVEKFSLGGYLVTPGCSSDDPLTWDEFTHPPFPVSSLPRVLRDMVLEMDRAEGLSPVLSSMCCLAAASACLGNKIRMDSSNTRTVMGNLYMAASADSGTGKSTACNRAYQPIRDFEAKRLAQFGQTLPGLKAEADKLRKEVEAAVETTQKSSLMGQIAALEAKMGQPCLTTSDATSEKLMEMMSRSGGAMAMLSGESRSAVDILGGRYRGKGQTDENFYLSAYSGEAVGQDRITRGNVSVVNPCLTLLWHLQPDKFEELMGKSALHESGFLCRMLFCNSWAKSPGVRPYGTTFSSAIADHYAERLTELLSTYRTSQQEYHVEMKQEAWNAITTYDEFSRSRITEELGFMGNFVSRWGENTFRLALVFHVAEHGGRAHLEKVSKATAEAAVNVVSWFAHQQVMLLSEAARTRAEACREKVLSYLARHPGTTCRDIGRGVAQLGGMVKAILAELVNDGLVKTEDRHGVGRSSIIYSIKKPRI